MPISNHAADACPRSILITGASSGIGEALAIHYAAPGVTLFLSGRNEDRLRAVAGVCAQRGAVVEGRVIDVCDQQSMREWIAGCDRMRPLDLVVANAGISGGSGVGGETPDQVRDIFAVNLHGVFNTVLPALDPMLARGRGQVAMVASLAGFSGWPGAPAYGASKAAVRLYGEALRGTLQNTGVRISVICPGFVRSRMTAANDYPMPFLMDSDRAARIIARGLARNRGRIAFPFRAYLLTGMVGIMPFWLSSTILKNMPRKAPLPRTP